MKATRISQEDSIYITDKENPQHSNPYITYHLMSNGFPKPTFAACSQPGLPQSTAILNALMAPTSFRQMADKLKKNEQNRTAMPPFEAKFKNLMAMRAKKEAQVKWPSWRMQPFTKIKPERKVSRNKVSTAVKFKEEPSRYVPLMTPKSSKYVEQEGQISLTHEAPKEPGSSLRSSQEEEVEKSLNFIMDFPRVMDSFESVEPKQRLPMQNSSSKAQQSEHKMKKNLNMACSNFCLPVKYLNSCEKENSVGNSVANSVANSLSIASSTSYSQKYMHYKRKAKPDIKLGDFLMIKDIGTGKYGKVTLAIHRKSGFLVALKAISKQLIRKEQIAVPFLQQIKIQAFMSHPNIVQLYGCFHDAQNVYLALEYCSGGNLKAQIKTNPPENQNQMLQLLLDMFEAVSFLHSQGVIHRDLKPENVVVQQGICKLCDFGWAVYAGGDNRTTFCGTPLYLSPQILQNQEYNTAIDVWGLGVIAYEIVFSQAPFSIMEQHDLWKIVRDPVYFPLWKNVSPKVTNMIARMLDKQPQKRASLSEILTLPFFQQVAMQNSAMQQEMRCRSDIIFPF